MGQHSFLLAAKYATLLAILGPALAACNALDQSTEPAPISASSPANAAIPSAPTPQPQNAFAAPANNNGFTAPANAFAAPSVQQGFTTQTVSGFPEATISPDGTVGRYQVGPSYSLNGQVITPRENLTYTEVGVAGWYGDGFEGATTANGEKLNSGLRTFAHRTLPFGTIARITNTSNGRAVVARVNDRGPIQADRLVDVTTRIAQELGLNDAGRAQVQVAVMPNETRQVASLTGGSVGGGGTVGSVGSVNTANTAPNLNIGQSNTSALNQPTPIPVGSAGTFPNLANPTPLPGRATGTTGSGVVYVQAGSFRDQSNAVRLQGLLNPIGPVLVEPVSVNGQQFWRVRVGPYGSESEARITLGRVVAAGATDAIIRRVN